MITMEHILVVDDSEDSRRATVRILRKAGYTVTEAESGEQCLEIMRLKVPDLVLLDVQLPGIDGLEVCKRIKSDDRLGQAFVVHFSAVHTTSNDQSKGLEEGSDGYLIRPLESRELLARVEAFLRHKRTIDSLRKALDEIKTLKGLLPICSSCKKIRDDEGFWSNVETYLSKHSDFTFTHGICPDCSNKFIEGVKMLIKKEKSNIDSEIP